MGVSADNSGKPATPPGARAKVSPYERLRSAIVTGELEPDAPLVETALATWLEVSRTPVREALTRLEQDGMVTRGRNGLVVRARSTDEILDLYQTRILLEAAVARNAAERRTTNDLLVLRGHLGRWNSVDLSDEWAMFQANEAFHESLWKASHNEALIDVLSRLTLHLKRFPVTTLSAPGRWDQAGAEHEAIVEAIDKRDGDTASKMAAQHFEESMQIRLALWGNR